MTSTAPGGTDEEVAALVERTERPRQRRWTWLAVSAVMVLVVGWAFVAGQSLGRDPRQVESALIGKEAPGFRLPALEGSWIDSDSFRGEVLVVNFWASWCVPCREEAPELQSFAERWAGRGINVVGIVYNDEEAEAAGFRDEFGLTYPQVLDPDGRAAIDFGVFGVPETYVVDRDGIVMAKLAGAVNAATLDQVVAGMEEGRTASSRNDRYRTEPGQP